MPKLKMERHYIHNDIPVRFDSFLDGKLTNPTFATADVYDPESNFIATGPAKHSGGEVKFIIPGEKVNMIGVHAIIFKIGMRGMGDKEHIVKVRVINMPIKKKEKV